MIVKIVYQVVGGILRTHDLNDYIFGEINPWGSIIYNIANAVCNTYYTTTKASPRRLTFGKNMLFNILRQPNWKT